MPDGDPTRAWPDGNTSLLRLLVSKLIPNAIGDVNGAPPDQDNILVAKADYGAARPPRQQVRIRLNRTVAESSRREGARPARHGRGRPATSPTSPATAASGAPSGCARATS